MKLLCFGILNNATNTEIFSPFRPGNQISKETQNDLFPQMGKSMKSNAYMKYNNYKTYLHTEAILSHILSPNEGEC